MSLKREYTYIVTTKRTVEANARGHRFFTKQEAQRFQRQQDRAKLWGSVLYVFAAGDRGSMLFPYTFVPPTFQVHYEPRPIPGTEEDPPE